MVVVAYAAIANTLGGLLDACTRGSVLHPKQQHCTVTHQLAWRLWLKGNPLMVVSSLSPYAIHKPVSVLIFFFSFPLIQGVQAGVIPIFIPEDQRHT